MLVRYEFNPTDAPGDEYALTVGLELGKARDLPLGTAVTLGSVSPPARVRGYATVACLCPPLRLDSLRGTFRLDTRGMRQLTGRLDAAFYFREWDDSSHHARYALHQRLDAIK